MNTIKQHTCRILMLIILSAMTSQYVAANKTLHPRTHKKSSDLKQFEGYYQFVEDNDIYIQISARENKMILKQMWDNKEITFEQKSDLEFFNSESQFPLKFTRANGRIVQVLAFNKDVWKKVDKYSPEINKEITLAAAQLKSLEGYYKLDGKEMYLKMTVNGNGLVVKEIWSGKEINVAPKSQLEFYGRDFRYPVKFTKDEKSGVIKEALIFKRDKWVKVDSYPSK